MTEQQTNEFERIHVYGQDEPATPEGPFGEFLTDSGNQVFRRSTLTWVSLFFLLGFYPIISIAFAGDTGDLEMLKNNTILMITLISTIIMQWAIFLLILGAVSRERTGLSGIGFRPARNLDLPWWQALLLYTGWGIAFLLAANLILTGLAWCLAQVGLPMPGEISFLIPQDATGRIVWVAVSFTAGFCEETMFRGYLMTRLRILGKSNSWILPSIISAVAFGACHAYQGLPGFIVLTVYGLMFSYLYIRTGSIWPGIIAHFFQDFMALFIPQ